MKKSEVKPNAQTFVCLLNACAAAGRLDRVYVTFFYEFSHWPTLLHFLLQNYKLHFNMIGMQLFVIWLLLVLGWTNSAMQDL